jgi:predicted MPP superfamily phosphohydrolase
MTSFGWLHLTDLHLGMAQQPAFLPNVRARLFDDLKRIYEKSNPWDLVIFTGDLTFKGSAEEFKKVDEFLGLLWDCLRELGSNPSLLAVPGNHDLTRPDPNIPNPWLKLVKNNWSTDEEIRKEFWTNPASEYRQPITSAFENYARWWEKTQFKLPAQPGELPGDFSAVLEKDGTSLGIVGLNTAFLQLSEGDYKGKLAIDPIQFNRACGGDGPAWVKRHNTSLLLTHQPPDWLTPDSQAQLEAEIAGYDNFAVHLFGHMHEARYSAQARGGAPELRAFQATSLFGLETFGESKKIERRHGYAVGRIELEGDKGGLTFWPRHAKLGTETRQWNVVVDTDIFLDKDEHTLSRSFPLTKALQILAPFATDDAPDVPPSMSVDKQPSINRWAFMVGVNDYQYFAKLRYCRHDTVELARAFRNVLGFQNVFEFHEEAELKPDRDSILQKLAAVRDSKDVKPKDLLVFYFSGHGINEEGTDYLLPIGARPKDVSTLGIRVKDLVKSLKGFRCENTILFIDACREAVQGTKGTSAIGEDSSTIISKEDMVAFFSCDPRERSYEIEDLKHGAFTYCILQAIQEGAVETINDLDRYLEEKVPKINDQYQMPPQQPYSIIVPPTRGGLTILFNPRQGEQVVQKFADLIEKLTGLRKRREISVVEWVNAIAFLGKIENKRLNANETSKLGAINALADEVWPPDIFRTTWKSLDVRRLAAPTFKTTLPRLN